MAKRIGGELRGNSSDRRRRKIYLINTFGNGKNVPCFHCGRKLSYDTMEVDRHPVCGHNGGRYVKENVVPACNECNIQKCNMAVSSCRKVGANG